MKYKPMEDAVQQIFLYNKAFRSYTYIYIHIYIYICHIIIYSQTARQNWLTFFLVIHRTLGPRDKIG